MKTKLKDRKPQTPPKPPAAVAPEWKRHVIPIAVLWALTLAVYSNSFQGGFVYDSASRILQDSRVHAATAANVNLIFHSDYWYPALGSGLYRPLTTLSFLFNYAVMGNQTQPFGYHFLNWMLHSVNAMLVYLLVWLLLGETLWAAVAAGLWAVHPLLTESVTNLVGRADLLAGIGVLGGLLCYVLATREAGRRHWIWLGAAAALTALGIFSKESAVVVLPLAVLYDVSFGIERRQGRAAAYAALALPCLVYLIMRLSVFANAAPQHIPFTDNPIAGAGFVEGKLTAIKVIGKQLMLLVWPAQLSCDYSYNQVPLASWTDWRLWTALAACLAAVAAGVMAYRRNYRTIFFWIGFFFLALAPTANLAKAIGTVMAERFLYLPAIAFAACLVAALRRMPKTLGLAAAGLIAMAFGARTYARNFDWKDDLALWRSAVAAAPNSYRTHLSLAPLPLNESLPEIERSVAIVESLPDEINTPAPFVTGGQRFREKGDLPKSLALLLRGERIQRSHYERIRRESQGTSLGVGWSPIYEELAKTYLRLGDFPHAAEAVKEALKLRTTPELFEQLSAAYYRMGDRNRAAVSLLEGLAVNRENQKLGGELISLYGEIDAGGCAVQAARGGKALNLDCPLVHEHACTAWQEVAGRYQQTGQTALALQTARYATDSMGCK